MNSCCQPTWVSGGHLCTLRNYNKLQIFCNSKNCHSSYGQEDCLKAQLVSSCEGTSLPLWCSMTRKSHWWNPCSHHPAEQSRLCEAVRHSPVTSLGAPACHYFYRFLPIHTQTNYSRRAGNIPNFEQLTKGSSPPLGDVAYTVLTGF